MNGNTEKIAVIGAGKTGRGFVARLCAQSRLPVHFVDTDENLIRRLNENKQFTVRFFGDCRLPVTVDGYTASLPDEAELTDADLLFVSVGGTHLAQVGSYLRQKLLPTRRYTVITCENTSTPAKKLREAIGMDNVYVSEATVFCTTVADGELDILSEDYPYLQCDADLLAGYESHLEALRPMHHFENLLTRKLFTYNAASAIISYIGWYKGYTVYSEAANDPEILQLMDQNYAVTNRVMCRQFGYTPEDQNEFALLSKKKFCDKTIVDTIERNAREPQRKLTSAERIIGPLKLIFEMGEDTSVLEYTAACALLYRDEADETWCNWQRRGRDCILQEICGLSPMQELYQRIAALADKLEK